jgi:hypothetical protein
MFTRTDDYMGLNGSSLRTYVSVSPTDLINWFGEPGDCDEYKVSMEWLFEDEEGNIISLYDWKSTSLYDESLPSPQAARLQDTPYEFHVGSRSYEAAHNFVEWLSLRVKNNS